MTTTTHQQSNAVWWRMFRRVCVVVLAVCMLATDSMCSVVVAQQEKPPIRLRLLPLSVRNRSNGAIPVRMRLEYNLPKFVEGDLELVIYDGKNTTVPEDHIATMRFTDIVLPGQDYERIILLPPLRMGVQKTWSIMASFTTKEGVQYPLSASATQFNPPMPHELLTTSPLDRGVLVCSCVSKGRIGTGSPTRAFLEKALVLDNYNPATNADVGVPLEIDSGADRSVQLIGRQIVHHNQELAAADLPADPLSYCAFDLVLISDGGLASLKAEQLVGMRKWVAAGGSVCVVPDGSLKPIHSDFLNKLLEEDNPADTTLTLADDGSLLVISEQPNAILKARYGLGRVVILPNDEALVARLLDKTQPVELGSVVGFLWKVNSDLGVHSGKLWGSVNRNPELLERVRALGWTAEEDENGVYLEDLNELRQAKGYITRMIGRRGYINPQLFESNQVSSSLSPRNEPLLNAAQTALLPEDIQMVPTWVFAMILTAYVMTIGPVDYFVLGWLKLRKLTWILFPIVTFFYTGLTVAVAWAYMSSDDTGGRLIITDVGLKGVPLRQTTLETFYFGSSRVASRDMKNSIVVQGEQLQLNADYDWNMDGSKPKISPHAPLRYEGNFPQSYQTTQPVEQWSPLTVRSMTLEPENVNVPVIDWENTALVNTENGIAELANMLSELERNAKNGEKYGAAICSASSFRTVRLPQGEYMPPAEYQVNQFGRPFSIHSGLPGVLGSIPNSAVAASTHRFDQYSMPSPGIFQVVSQIAPDGCTALEDLNILDPGDPEQKVLIIVRQEGEDFHVFRKLYVMRVEK